MLSTSNLSPAACIAESRRVRLERLLQIAAHDPDLRLEFGKSDRLGEGHIVLGIEIEQAATGAYVALKGAVLHLLGHYLTNMPAWVETARGLEAGGRPYFTNLWHALEDARLENWMVRRWPGTYRAFHARILPNLGGSVLRMMASTYQVEMGLYLEGRGYRGAQYARQVRDALTEVAGSIEWGANGESPRASLDAMDVIYPSVAHLLRASHRFTAPRPQKKRQPPEIDQQGGRPRDNAPDRGRETPPDGAPEIELSDDLVSVGVMGRRREFPEWFRPGSAPWFERGLGEKAVHPSAVRTDRQTIVDPPPGDADEYRRLRAEVQHEVGYLAHRLTNLLSEEVYLRYGGYYRSGRLNMAKLWKQRMGNFRLFQRRITGGPRAIAFTLLVDESTSMKGQDKYRTAIKAAILLGETLARLDVPLEIIGYTTADFEARAAMRLGLMPAHEYRTVRCTPLEHRLYKRFDEPYHIVRHRLTGIQPRHNNWDEEHLQFAFRRIQARPEQRRVIITISDGQPNGNADYLIETVAMVERMGCKVVGIGIGADFVRQIYRDAIVVSSFRQMADELLGMLVREFRGGPVLTRASSATAAGRDQTVTT